MRLGLTQQLRTEQRLVQSPQMIQAMQILQCPMMELRDQVETELQENVFLEVREETEEERQPESRETDPEAEQRFEQFQAALEQLEARSDGPPRPNRESGGEEGERRLEALYNTPGPGDSLADYLLSQVRMLEVESDLFRVVEHVIFSLDGDGRLGEDAEQIANDLLVPIPLAESAVQMVRSLEPSGVGARDLRDCLLMQLDRLQYVRPLTRRLVEHYLDDLAMNKLPKIAKGTGATVDEVKESWEFMRTHLAPHPGAAFSRSVNATVIPDVVVEEVDGRFEVRAERGSIPDLSISPVYRNLLKEAKEDPKVYDYLRKKIESAKWFIEAVHQRQSTIQRIASEVVERQEGFLRHGVQHLRPMRMQDVADAVGVHISTVSRAISGKFIQTPQGIFDMKRFFSGGTVTDTGKMVSQQAVKDTLKEIVAQEDKASPLSDDQLVEALTGRGVKIARRTVTKYRKALGIESSTRRREF